LPTQSRRGFLLIRYRQENENVGKQNEGNLKLAQELPKRHQSRRRKSKIHGGGPADATGNSHQQ
jgi:hypothetical protein